MKDTPLPIPENIKNDDSVTEQFVTANREQMWIPKTMRGVPGFLYRLFTKTEQVMLEKKPD